MGIIVWDIPCNKTQAAAPWTTGGMWRQKRLQSLLFCLCFKGKLWFHFIYLFFVSGVYYLWFYQLKPKNWTPKYNRWEAVCWRKAWFCIYAVIVHVCVFFSVGWPYEALPPEQNDGWFAIAYHWCHLVCSIESMMHCGNGGVKLCHSHNAVLYVKGWLCFLNQ